MLRTGRKRVFNSVFPPISPLENLSIAPVASPTTVRPVAPAQPSSAFSSLNDTATDFRQPFPAFDTQSHDKGGAVDESERLNWARAWKAATTFLCVPDHGFGALKTREDVHDKMWTMRWIRCEASNEVRDALVYVLKPSSKAAHSREPGSKNLLDWYGDEIRRHFLTNFRGGLLRLLNDVEYDDTLRKVVYYLQLARTIYFTPLYRHLLPLLDAREQEQEYIAFQRVFHSIVTYALPWSRLSALIARNIAEDAFVVLGIDTLIDELEGDTIGRGEMDVDRGYSISYYDWKTEPSEQIRIQMMTEREDSHVSAARTRLLSLMDGLQMVGLGGDRAQEVFANVMNSLLTEFVRVAYSGQWEGLSLAIQHLRLWIMNFFARLVVQVLAIINAPELPRTNPQRMDVSFPDVTRWQEVGVRRLGELRTMELFDIIVEWPGSIGAIEDLRHFTTQPAARSYVTLSFISALNQRLLHPGASTVEILQLYISIIGAFNVLDPRGVILDRIARPIRRYLREREDTIKVIVGGLLSDTPETSGKPSSSGEVLVELSAELTKAQQTSQTNTSGELDWDDLNWMPDPIDAAPDYRKSKTSDVIGSLISLFDSTETFVKELQKSLADRLLKNRVELDQETLVLELLKIRFGDSALQPCEVMLRDIFDSRRLDAVVRSDQEIEENPAVQFSRRPHDFPRLHAKVLSRFFWPELATSDFKVPAEISSLQQRYASGFESLKQSRKLTWLNGLGQATVELDLDDRVFVDQVTTWQATVIYAFQSEPAEPSTPATRTVTQLSQQLDMPAALVRSACLYWVSRRILTEVSRDTFRVLEALPNEGATRDATKRVARKERASESVDDTSIAATEAATAAAAKETAQTALMEKMNLYWQFIVGMLTNQGAMPLQRIVMMLKIAVPGGFPFSNEELRDFLAGMVAQGKLEVVAGGCYKLITQ